MKKMALGIAVVLLISCVYIGAISTVTGEDLRPPTIAYILNKITSHKYYVNVQDTIKQIEDLWSANTNPSADAGGGDNNSGGGRYPEDTPSWVISFTAWLEQSAIGRVFLTIASVVEIVVLGVYDTILAILYLFKILSVFLTGIPV